MTLVLYPMAFAMGHILPPLRGSVGPGDFRFRLVGRSPERNVRFLSLKSFANCGVHSFTEIIIP